MTIQNIPLTSDSVMSPEAVITNPPTQSDDAWKRALDRWLEPFSNAFGPILRILLIGKSLSKSSVKKCNPLQRMLLSGNKSLINSTKYRRKIVKNIWY